MLMQLMALLVTHYRAVGVAHGFVDMLLMRPTALTCSLQPACLASCAVDALMRSKGFILTAVQLAWLTMLSTRSCGRTEGLHNHHCAACVAHGAVDVLTQSTALKLTAVQLAWLTALSTC